jgi:6-phosphogluconolactonase
MNERETPPNPANISMKTTFSTVLLMLTIAGSFANGAEPLRFFVGTYTAPTGSRGIYTGQFDTERGTLTEPTLVAECNNPAFLALHPSRPYLYAVCEIQKGMLLAFQYNKANGQLTPLDEKEALGQTTCHLAICQPDGRAENSTGAVVIANYSSGNIVSFPLLENGKIGGVVSDIKHEGFGPNTGRQESAHPHGVYFDGTTIAVPDLGIDQVVYYKIDIATAALSASSDDANLRLAPGAGPRHITTSKDKRLVYVLNELDSTVSVFDRRTTQPPERIQTVSTLTAGKDAATLNNTTAEIELHPNGKFLYASNRGDDSIAVFAVSNGKLTLLQKVSSGGQTPRFFCLDPTGRFLLACNQDTGNICVFSVEQETGKLTPTNQSVNVSGAICLVFVQ